MDVGTVAVAAGTDGAAVDIHKDIAAHGAGGVAAAVDAAGDAAAVDGAAVDGAAGHSDGGVARHTGVCGFKHFTTYCVRKCFATSQSFAEDTPEDTRWVTLVTVLMALLGVCQVLEQHGDHILNSKPTATEGLTPASAK